MNYVYVIFCCLVSMTSTAEVVEQNLKSKVTYLEAGEVYVYEPLRRHRGFFERDLRTYCYRGEEKTLARFFETIELILEIKSDDYTQYDGATPDEVQQHYDEHRSLFSFNLFNQKRTRVHLSPFNSSCMGIETIESYRIRLQKVRVDFWRVIQLVLGCLIFCYAGKLSQNAVFYYLTGVALGICSSFMLLIWLSSKLFPRRTMMYGVLIGGWTIGLYVIQMLWDNLQLIFVTYRAYVFWYITITGIVSFLFCYRWGPPTNKRSRNIIKWLLQLMSLLVIYCASHYEEATSAAIILTILLYYFPRSLLYRVRALWLRMFPPKRRLLTTDEYYLQGVKETSKALDELRKYASSPECKQWRVMSKLHDPLRFAAFVEGASHLRDEEILYFESSRDAYDDSDLSLNDDSEEEGEMNKMQFYAKQRGNGFISSNTVGDISEDEDGSDEVDNNERDRATPSRYDTDQPSTSANVRSSEVENNVRTRATPSRYNTDQPSTSANASLSKQRFKHLTPTLRPRQSSAPRSLGRSQRLYEHEFSDES